MTLNEFRTYFIFLLLLELWRICFLVVRTDALSCLGNTHIQHSLRGWGQQNKQGKDRGRQKSMETFLNVIEHMCKYFKNSCAEVRFGILWILGPTLNWWNLIIFEYFYGAIAALYTHHIHYHIIMFYMCSWPHLHWCQSANSLTSIDLCSYRRSMHEIRLQPFAET